MKITMVGAGYVGLVSAACFAEFGINVTCFDKNTDRIRRLQQGEVPVFEPGLDQLTATNMRAGRLHFDTDLKTSMANADAVFIAVNTPSRRGDGHADLSYVFAAAAEIAEHLTNHAVIVTKSTVPVGTNRRIERIIKRARPNTPFDVCANPDFMREGSAIQDFMRPDRIVIGSDSDSENARRVMRALYRPLYLLETPVVFTGLETAELIKYAANAYLAMKSTFINQIADLAKQVGADIEDVADALGRDGRIGRKHLRVGPGFGGSCLPKDLAALLRTAEEVGKPLTLLEEVMKVNEQRKKRGMAERIIDACGGEITGKRIAILGLTFKPNTDDIRDSASLSVIQALKEAGATICAYDPEGMDEAKKLMPDIQYSQSPYDAMQGANAAVFLTEWNELRSLDLVRMRELLTDPVVVDLRNIYRPDEMRAAGLRYSSLGRGPAA